MEPIKVLGVWTVGLAVLLGTIGVSLAQQPKVPGRTWCVCTCDSQSGPGCGECSIRSWELTYHCHANGRLCKSDTGKRGTLTNCNYCKIMDDFKFGQCSTEKPLVAPPEDQPPKVPRTRVPQPPTGPTVR